MRQQSNGTGLIRILSVSPFREDHLYLQRILANSKWILETADHLQGALALLQRHDPSVVICERDLGPGTWTDILDHTNRLPHPPSVVITSRLADERLWSEILNRGAWDLLAKPFDRIELVRSVKSAWEHWRLQIDETANPMKAMKAAS
jgi:DNA-binding NtrC family response regulator